MLAQVAHGAMFGGSWWGGIRRGSVSLLTFLRRCRIMDAYSSRGANGEPIALREREARSGDSRSRGVCLVAARPVEVMFVGFVFVQSRFVVVR